VNSFAMPAVYDSLVHRQHLSPHKAWRVAFIVPFILITATAITILLVCPDTPTGKWSERHLAVQNDLATHDVSRVVDTNKAADKTKSSDKRDEKLKLDHKAHDSFDQEAQLSNEEMVDMACGEIIRKPSFRETFSVIFSLQTLVLMAGYFCSFGGELAINSTLGAYYDKSFPRLGQTGSSKWAAMFGLLNIITRPAGGFISDLMYKYTHSLWVKKFWIHFTGVVSGAFLIVIGITDSHHLPTLVGLFAGMAFFLEAGNGANFALVPHVHPFANGKLPVQPHAAHIKNHLANMPYARHCIWFHWGMW
jgi:NNP family nitrate/nitrite transporter-like MFS transporter